LRFERRMMAQKQNTNFWHSIHATNTNFCRKHLIQIIISPILFNP
jgi:hypothetical protein